MLSYKAFDYNIKCMHKRKEATYYEEFKEH